MLKNEFRNISIIDTGFFIVSTVLIMVSAISFISFKNNLSSNGFTDLTQFKYLYSPLKILGNNTIINLWASALIIFLTLNSVLFIKIESKIFKFIVGSGIFINIFCLLATLSRGTYLAFFIFLLVANLSLIKRIKIRKIIFANLAILAMIVISAVIIGNSVQTTTAFSKTASQQRSTSGRIHIWENGLQMVGEKPLFGQGQKNYKLAFEKNPIVAEDTDFPVLTHNSYLQLIIERGIFGLTSYTVFVILVLFIFVKTIHNINQPRRNKIYMSLLSSGIIAFLVRDLTFSTFFFSDMIHFLFFYLIFNMIAYDIKIKSIEINEKQRLILICIVSLLILLVSVGTLYKWQAEKNNNKFVNYYHKDKINTSVQFLDKAMNILPGNFELNRHKAFSLDKNSYEIDISANHENIFMIKVHKVDSLKKAAFFYKKALEKRPNNLEILQNLGWIYMGMGNEKIAEKYFKRALEKNEYELKTLTSLFLLKIQNEKIEEAKDILVKLLRYSPSILESKLYIEFSVFFPDMVSHAKLEAIDELNKKTEKGNNYIFKARLARLLLNENPDKAKKLLCEITQNMPGLTLPWVYKGLLNSNENKMKEATSDFKKGLLLNESDLISTKYYANYLRMQSDHKNAIKFYKKALLASVQPKTIPYKKNTGIANLNEIYTSDILEDLSYNTNLMLNSSELFLYFSEYYIENNDTVRGEYYKNLSVLYNGKFYKGENVLK